MLVRSGSKGCENFNFETLVNFVLSKNQVENVSILNKKIIALF
jgi:hypothetical protein